MVTKPATKKTTSKKPVSSKTTSKAPVAKPAATENNLQKVVDLQAKQILKMEKMIQSLDAELKEIKKLVMSEGKPALASVASKAKAPVKTAVMSSKAVSAGSDKKTSAPAKKTATAAKSQHQKQDQNLLSKTLLKSQKRLQTGLMH